MFELIGSLELDLAGARATAWATVPGDLPWLADHFPGAPLLPGSVAAELCAQAAGPLAEEALLARDGLRRFAVLAGIRDLRFLLPVDLPAEVRIEVRLLAVDRVRARANVAAHVAGVPVLRGALSFAMIAEIPPTAAAARTERLARWGARRA